MPLYKVVTYRPPSQPRGAPTRTAFAVQASSEGEARREVVQAHPWAASNAMSVSQIQAKVFQILD